jgi:MOSC domain-containing protein YiiM
LKNLPIGAQLKIGETIHEVTQIGKECHHGCEIRQIVGDCVMPREGIFTKVIRSGILHINDSIEVIKK